MIIIVFVRRLIFVFHFAIDDCSRPAHYIETPEKTEIDGINQSKRSLGTYANDIVILGASLNIIENKIKRSLETSHYMNLLMNPKKTDGYVKRMRFPKVTLL